MQKTTTHWPSIVILIIVIVGAGVFLLSALGFGITSIMGLVSNGPDPAGTMIGALATGFEALLLVGVAWFVFQKTSGQAKADEPFQLPFAPWHIFAALGVGLVALLIGAAVSYLEIKLLSWFVLPFLTLLLIVPPIWILLGIGTNKLDFGPRWRALGIFGIGMTLGPLIMVSLEILLLIVFVIVIAVVLASRPDMVGEMTRLATLLENETDPEAIMRVLSPYIFKPNVIAGALAYISLAVPMIEELFKPLGIWLFLRKIETPTQGFALGLLSGAAYAVVESLGASGQGTNMWGVVVAVRAGTSLLHIMTTGLMGYAIISAMHQRRYLQLMGTYLLVILIHGIWNASAVAASLSVASDLTMNTSWTFSVLPAAVCGITVLGIGMVVLLVASNRRVRKLSEKVSTLQTEEHVIPVQNDEGVK